MTWREFKELLESKGIRDMDEIEYIDVNSYVSEDTISIGLQDVYQDMLTLKDRIRMFWVAN